MTGTDYAGGVEMRIRGLPEDVGRHLKALAAIKGTSLNQLVLDLLADYAKRTPIKPEPTKR